METKEERETLFIQCYLAGKAVKDEEGWEIIFSVLDGPSVGMKFKDELEAKAAYKVMEEHYIKALKVIQEAAVKAHDDNTEPTQVE